MRAANQRPNSIRARCPKDRRVRGGAIAIITVMVALALFHVGVAATYAQAEQHATTAVTELTRPTGATTPSIRPALTPIVLQPRPTGYFVGDLVTQRVLLEGGAQPITLPSPGRVNSWFERRGTTFVTDASARRWLVIQYQFLNAPKAVTVATLPAWQLTVKTPTAASSITLKIPAVSLNIAPLSPPGSPEQVGTSDLRPDRLPPNIATTPILHGIAIASGGLALTLAAWLTWVLWRNRRADVTQPFAHALRELRTLTDGEPRAWQILHRAFDRAAGRVIQSATLPVLFERAPQLAPARPEIEKFFAQSNQLFFASGNSTPIGGDPSRANLSGASRREGLSVDPLTLCLALRRIEKRHET